MVVLFGCEKSEDRSCWKFVGDPAVKEIEVEGFDKLDMGPHLTYTLVQDTVERVTLIGGENLLNFIECKVEDKKLIIRDKNKCSFLRQNDSPVHVQIHVKKVVNILFEGTHSVRCANQLNSDYFTLVLRDGSGEFNLNINAIALYASVTHGWGNFNIQGEVDYFNAQIRSNGFGNAYNLQVKDSLHAISWSTETFRVNPNNCSFRAQTHSSGDIWYIGTPTSLEYNQYGSGQLVDKN